MNIKIGTLQTVPVSERFSLTSHTVAEALLNFPSLNEIGVVEIDANLSDTTAFCEHYQVRTNQAANCVVLQAKRSERVWFATCVILGNTRTDINGLARRTLDARKVSFAPMEQAVTETRMEYGAITPIGLPTEWSILIDKAVTNSEYVIIGSGLRKSKLVVPGNLLASLPNVQILEDLGRVTDIS